MPTNRPTRRRFLTTATAGAVTLGALELAPPSTAQPPEPESGAQRLPLEKLKEWESWKYGMFIHYGMSTYVENELPDGKAPASTYAPTALDV
ncbi:MAG: twin-arginine translocation signal domain-containing protein, partial [Candidatus Hydrogenedentes bacterium]|nr:twin-arginine translocation signal domain-containing protein [Candidatus Hydrogenedentota bacterium]